MAANHAHVRGIPIQAAGGGITGYKCEGCMLRKNYEWWWGHEAAVAGIEANGLPDHERRVKRLMWRFVTETVSPIQAKAMVEADIIAYFAPLPPKEE